METLNLILYYIFGLLSTSSLLLLWFFSPLKITLGRIFFDKELLSEDEFDDRLSLVSKKLGIMSGCWTCCSFWFSLIVGLLSIFIFNLKWWYPLVTFLTYPSLLWAIKVYVFSKRMAGHNPPKV